MSKTNQNQILAKIALEQNYKVVEYQERRGIKGFINWWATVKKDSFESGIDLVINTRNKFDRIIVNGQIIFHKNNK